MDYFLIINLLLKMKGIDVNLEDSNGKKPIDYSKDDQIRRLLSKWFSFLKMAINKKFIFFKT